MKKEMHVDTWEQCRERLLQIKEETSGEVWFRSQSRACWPLTATLERPRIDKRPKILPDFAYSIADYWALMLKIKPQIEAATGVAWEMPVWSEPPWPFAKYFRENSGYGYMAYLRHHGFPSPLLDWTRSPYVAAYFAFAKPGAGDNAAIYAFLERPPTVEFSPTGGPEICTRGWCNLKTHKRHSRQESSYTVCVEWDDETQHWRFIAHQRVFAAPRGQVLLYKTTVPAGERNKILKQIDQDGFNAFSLLGSEDGLMEMLAFREIDLELI